VRAQAEQARAAARAAAVGRFMGSGGSGTGAALVGAVRHRADLVAGAGAGFARGAGCRGSLAVRSPCLS
jgi:hypothetical protein